VSLIPSFPLCNSLSLRDCANRGRPAVGNVFAGLPEHRLSIKDLQLSSTLSIRTLIDVSNLIEDAALGVESLTALVYDVGSSEKTRRSLHPQWNSSRLHAQCQEVSKVSAHRSTPNDDESNIWSKRSWTICQGSGP